MNKEIANKENCTASEPEIEAALVDRKVAAKLLGISESKFSDMKAQGKLGPAGIRFGRAVRYDREELLAWARAGAPSRERWQAMRQK